MSALRVTVDGEALGDDEARALWKRFSAYMDEHRGDLEGFAKSEGFASAHPENRDGAAVLVLSRTRAQAPYGAPARSENKGGNKGASQGANRGAGQNGGPNGGRGTGGSTPGSGARRDGGSPSNRGLGASKKRRG